MSQQENETKYYKPAVPKVEGLELKPSEVPLAEELRGIIDADGLIKTEMENDVVLSRIAKDIYKNFLSGYRETYANAITACQVASETFKCSPHIEVTLDMDNRMLQVKEVDSTGISPAAFRDIYRVVGRTGNADGSRLGQFGFGRLAWISLSDRMLLETKWRATDGKTGVYALENKEGRAFAPIPAPEMDSFGTTLRFFLYETINMDQLLNYIRDAGRMVPVKTTLKLIKQFKETSETLNKTPAEMLAVHLDRRTDRRISTDILSYKDSELELYGLLDITAWNYWSDRDKKDIDFGDSFQVDYISQELFLLGLPIEGGYDIPRRFSRCVVNILDERKFPPTADRDRLREEAKQALNAKINQITTTLLRQQMTPKSLAEYMAMPKVWKMAMAAYRQDVTLGPVAEFVSNAVSLRGSGEREKVSVAKILNTIDKSKLFYTLNGFSPHYLNKARSVIPGALAMIVHSAEHVKLLEDFGIGSLKAYATNQKIATAAPADFVVYNSSKYRKMDRARVELAKIETKTIKVPEDKLMDPYVSLLNVVDTNYHITRDSKYLDAVGVKLHILLRKIGNMKVTTSAGDMTVKTIPKDAVVVFGVYDVPSVSQLVFGGITAGSLYKEPPEGEAGFTKRQLAKKVLGILADQDTIFELILYFKERGQKYIQDFSGRMSADKVMGINSKWSYYSSDYYQQLWARMHVQAVCKDPELNAVFQVVLENTSNFDELKTRRAKILETLDRLQSGGPSLAAN